MFISRFPNFLLPGKKFDVASQRKSSMPVQEGTKAMTPHWGTLVIELSEVGWTWQLFFYSFEIKHLKNAAAKCFNNWSKSDQAPDSHWHYACPLQPFFLEKPLQKHGLGSSLSIEVTSTLASYTTRDSKFCCVGIFSALLVTEIHHLGFHKFPNPHHPSGLIGCGLDVNHERLHIAHYQPPKLLHVPQTQVLTSLLYITLWFVVLSEEPSWAGTAPRAIKHGGEAMKPWLFGGSSREHRWTLGTLSSTKPHPVLPLFQCAVASCWGFLRPGNLHYMSLYLCSDKLHAVILKSVNKNAEYMCSVTRIFTNALFGTLQRGAKRTQGKL